ncbi:HAMP domain-containing protein [Salipaludibacillus agaradhaerens]|uniref:sensor histidine kinase n=1 Tax=Salipaludibacillus agaradhaerens TaxID=76935 RepID=UPI002151C964|nr:HAMP domain-containing sensor histidine kinase [Salipaludibacillus agaradhaerens]MCR6105128.1 HAMP domain-containing protein [Salipaludibacillus agaradhaerens]MCR6117173.1 HAMP domain-containing protein [Salipaludibacillus agaradhaerens]UJW56368.1 HAMP domain-containing protein [Bacillus sp. A116_S68]
MINTLIRAVKQSLAKKITTWVMAVLMVLVLLIVGGAHWITTNFYQEHLKNEVEERLRAHAEILLAEQRGEDIYQYLNQLEAGKNSYLIMTDSEGQLLFSTDNVLTAFIEDYLEFIETAKVRLETVDEDVMIDEVKMQMAFHIPHVWGAAVIRNDEGEATGYVFIDQDTEELNSARLKLLLLLVVMGAITLGIGYVLVSYLTRKISNPLNEMSQRTEDIAKGDFDIELHVTGKDEVGRLGENIRQMTIQLKEFRDSRRQFISHISHDLRTPITYIKGYSALMKDATQAEQEDWRRHLSVIYEEAKRMENLVSDLFLLTKLEEGKIQLEVAPLYVRSWLEALIESRAIMFDQKEITASLAIGPNLENTTVMLDSFRVAQALINLLENAIRFTPVGGKICLACYLEEDNVVFKVTDTGEGMGKKTTTYIWQRFYKGDPSRSRNNGGTGLGLAIVKQIAEAHDGFVDVTSEPGKGSSFYMYIKAK